MDAQSSFDSSVDSEYIHFKKSVVRCELLAKTRNISSAGYKIFTFFHKDSINKTEDKINMYKNDH